MGSSHSGATVVMATLFSTIIAGFDGCPVSIGGSPRKEVCERLREAERDDKREDRCLGGEPQDSLASER
jgi:hypothetical protein